MARKQGNGQLLGGIHGKKVGGLGDSGGIFRKPLIKVAAVVYHNGCAHATVIRTTELSADDRVGTWPIGGEGENRWLTWNNVLLDSELGNPKGMDDIICLHPQLHLLSFGYM